MVRELGLMTYAFQPYLNLTNIELHISQQSDALFTNIRHWAMLDLQRQKTLLKDSELENKNETVKSLHPPHPGNFETVYTNSRNSSKAVCGDTV